MTTQRAIQLFLGQFKETAYTASAPAVNIEALRVALDGTSNSVSATLAAPGSGMIGRLLAVRASNIDNAVTLAFTAVGGAKTIAFNAVDSVLLLIGATATKWKVLAAPAGLAFTQTYSTADRTIAALTTTALTDSGGGTADGTVASQAAPVTLTDSTGLSGTHDDTLAATTVPAALTEGAGAIGGTSDGDLTALVDPAGDAGASVIAGIRELATRVNTIQTLLGVMVQNQSDVAQKVIELVTLAGTSRDNLKEVTTQIAAIQADILADKKNLNAVIDALQLQDQVG